MGASYNKTNQKQPNNKPLTIMFLKKLWMETHQDKNHYAPHDFSPQSLLNCTYQLSCPTTNMDSYGHLIHVLHSPSCQ